MTWRAIWVLERIGNEDARAILKELVDRSPADPAAQEAKAALERLDRK
jgi:TolA-binding protein